MRSPLTRPWFRALRVLALLAVALVPVASRAHAQSGAKVERTPVAPVSDVVRIIPSPDRTRTAVVVRRGSRLVVNVDGVDGPRFDDILLAADRRTRPGVAFSADSRSVVYAGLDGADWVIMRDGTEIDRVTERQSAASNPTITELGFTADAGKVLYIEQNVQEGNRNGKRVVANGKRGPIGAMYENRGGYELPMSGDNFAYVLAPAASTQPHLVSLNGDAPQPVGNELRFTASGKWLLSQRSTRAGANGSFRQLLVNGRVVTQGESIRYWPGPVGEDFVAVVGVPPAQRSGGSMSTELVVSRNGKEFGRCASVDSVVFSKNGEHVGVVCGDANNQYRFLTERGKGSSWRNIRDPHMLDDGRPAYVGLAPNGMFVVVGEWESPAFDNGLLAVAGGRSPHGQFSLPSPRAHAFLLDTTVYTHPMGRGNDVRRLRTEGDHGRVAWFAGGLWVDGKRAVASIPPSMFEIPEHYYASRTGRHLAWAFWTKETGPVLVLDDRLIRLPQEHQVYRNVTFSPDEAHLYWIGQPNRALAAILVDGEEVLRTDLGFSRSLPAVRTPEVSDFETFGVAADGVLHLLGIENEVLTRFRITPDPSRSVRSLR